MFSGCHESSKITESIPEGSSENELAKYILVIFEITYKLHI